MTETRLARQLSAQLSRVPRPYESPLDIEPMESPHVNPKQSKADRRGLTNAQRRTFRETHRIGGRPAFRSEMTTIFPSHESTLNRLERSGLLNELALQRRAASQEVSKRTK